MYGNSWYKKERPLLSMLGFGGGVNGTAASDATIEYDENGTDELTFAGANVKFTSTKVTVNDQLIVGGNSSLGNIRIEDNIIASLAGQGNKIFIDPYPDGLSNEGDVIIFPAWLEHSAPLNKSSKLRSTISFNFVISDEVYEGGEFDPEKLIVDGGVS